MNTLWISTPLKYTGPELRPHFILQKTRLEGSSLIAFVGECDVKTEHLVDWEDKLQNDFIRARKMLHFLGEFFGITLAEGVWIQRLLVARCHVQLRELGHEVERDGDDLFWTSGPGAERRKLSVSIVTASPVSVLLHLGINLDAEGAPVQAAGLYDLGFSDAQVQSWAELMMSQFAEEYRSVLRACVKVRPVV